MPSTKLHIGFIGLGLMGKPMALNLQAAGHRLFVHNRSSAVVDELAGQGMRVCASPAEIAGRADIVILMLPDTAAVEKVLFGEFGLLENLGRGQVVVDMGTTDVTATRGFAKRVEAKGAAYVDAPVSGGQIGAQEGSLAVMVGARPQDFERVRPVLEVLGKNVTHVGEIGAGQVAKAANQVIVGLTIGAVAEAIHLARCCGVDPARMRAALQGGFAWSRIMEVHGQRMIDEQFEPGGRVTTQKKDLEQALALAKRVGASMPATGLNLELYEKLVAQGHGGLDHSALIKVLESS
jgi:2-hydroxy-3-oxopropionate reductase